MSKPKIHHDPNCSLLNGGFESRKTTGVHVYRAFHDLPATYEGLLVEGTRESFYLHDAWFRTLIESKVVNNRQVRLYGVTHGAGTHPQGLLAMYRSPPTPVIGSRILKSLSNFYTMQFAPILRPSVAPARVIEALIDHIARGEPHWDVVDFRALDRDSPEFEILKSSVRKAGFRVQSYFHFGNWYEIVNNDTLVDYFARRPSILLNTIKRKENKLMKLNNVRFRQITKIEELNTGIEDYQKVELQSWKDREPFPRFMPELMLNASKCGALRLGILYVNECPVAAQVWLVWNSRATIFKLNHVKEFDDFSVGSILTLRMIETLLRTEKIDEIDFGAGDQPYKSLWMTQRRERWGIIAFNRRTIRGNALAAWHIGGHRIKVRLQSAGRSS